MSENTLSGKLGPCHICGSYRMPDYFAATGNHVSCQDAQELKTLRADIARLRTALERIAALEHTLNDGTVSEVEKIARNELEVTK